MEGRLSLSSLVSEAIFILGRFSIGKLQLGLLATFIVSAGNLHAQTQTVIGEGLTGQALLDYVVANYKPSTTLGYDRARDTLYKVIDLQSGNLLTCIYSGFSITLNTELDPSTDAANKGINCEHSWPQSKGADAEPQQSDMHHLYPVKDNVNSSRGNNPYMEIPDANADVWFRNAVYQYTMPTSNLEEWAEKENNTPTGFEPRHASKGNVARSTFYFFAMYQAAADTNFWNQEKDVAYLWHYADPVDQDEYNRSYRIAAYQNNKPNPFVLDSTLARRIWFSGGYTPSQPQPTTLTAGDIAIIGANCDDADDFAFVLLKDINSTTTIKFTDNGWKSTSEFRTGEGILTYTAPSAKTAGTVIVYSSNTANFTASGSFALSTSGDQLLAYQGTEGAPTFLFAVNIKGSAVWQADATDANTSAVPSGLTNGTNCVALVEKDNVKYNGSTNFSTKDLALAAISNKDNWVGDDATRYTFTTIPDFSLPVTLESFTARVKGQAVLLSWVTESEIENQGFNLYRKLFGGEYALLSSFLDNSALVGQGTTTQKHVYAYTDRAVQPGATYVYQLADVDYAGNETKHKEVEVKVEAESKGLVGDYRLRKVYPNPFNASFTISLELGVSLPVDVRLYDVSGACVRTISNEVLSAGTYHLMTDTRDLPSGFYLLRMRVGNQTETQKIVLMK